MLFGFLLGLQHASEADHLAAVSTLVTERKSLLSSAFVGGVSGLGHMISLLVVGFFVLLLKFTISQRTENLLEIGIGIMLVLLGLNVLQKIARGAQIHFHEHEHNGHVHAHPHTHLNEPQEAHTHHGLSLSSRPFAVGMVHGLEGSAALMLLVIPTIDSRLVGLLYILIFGVGLVGGMMLMSLLVGLLLHFTALHFNRANLLLRCVAGLLSVGLGLFIVYEKGFAEKAII
ncbi:MAG: urease accessory protein [Chthoniobacterales bacterium]